MEIRPAEDRDFPALWTVLGTAGGIIRHTAYSYWVFHRMDRDALLLADADGVVQGVLLGVYRFAPQRALLLQIAVPAEHRRCGVATRLVTDFLDRCRARRLSGVDLTIDPGNEASARFFRAYASSAGTPLDRVGTTGTLGGVLAEEVVWRLALGDKAGTSAVKGGPGWSGSRRSSPSFRPSR